MAAVRRVHAIVKPKHWIGIVLCVALSISLYVAMHGPAPASGPTRTAPVTAPHSAAHSVAPPVAASPVAASPVAAPPVAGASTEPPPSPEDDLRRALDGKEPRRKAPAVPVRKPSGNYDVHTVDGFSIVHLGTGAPRTKPFGGPSNDPTHTINGRVVDRAGKPVVNAIVLADRGFNLQNNDIMTIGSTITDGAGAFSVVAPADEAYVLALVREDWSDIALVRDAAVELHMLGHGALTGRFTYSGGAETFAVHAALQGTTFVGRWQTASDGTVSIPSLPPGRYTVTVGLAQAFGGGVSRTLSRDVTIVDGKTTELALAFAAGTTVVVTAKPPAGSKPKGITYWLFSRRAPKDGAEARARKKAENAESLTLGGGAKGDPAEFHDVAPGTYYACAGFFDIATMDALDRPFGCTKVVVDDSETVREVVIALES